jgi:shikimate dehydrogenase
MKSSPRVKHKSYSLGLIGYPLGHSLSPQIHGAALSGLDMTGTYKLYPVAPGKPEGRAGTEVGFSLEALLTQMKDGDIHGLNVTIPHKQNVIPLLDELTPAAAAIGAVNTIFLRTDRLVGDNTDAPGFWEDLQRTMISQQQSEGSILRDMQTALVLGAGGSALAVVYALLIHGYQVMVAARRLEQAQALCQQHSAVIQQQQDKNLTAVSIFNLDTLIPNLQSQISLVINTTPVGMHPHENASPWPDGLPFPQSAAVYDLVYNPRETLLAKQARQAGLAASTGLGMLVEQAALAFERWTGVEAPRKMMLAAVSR